MILTSLIKPIVAALALGGSQMVMAQSAPGGELSPAEMNDLITRMLAGKSATQGEELAALLAEASEHPLGSEANPVRAQGPSGQRAYLARLRCSDTSRPDFERAGSVGPSPYGNVADLYIVTCDGAEPARSEVYMDMYHSGHVEADPVPGFGMMGGSASGRRAR